MLWLSNISPCHCNHHHHKISLHSVTCRCVMFIFITVTILGMVTVDVTLGGGAGEDQRKTAESVTSRREKRNVRSSTQGWGATPDQLFNILHEYETNHGNADLLLYTPTTPSPEDVNCHVEIPVTRRVGGKCVNLGSFIGCQAGIYLAFDSMCNTQMGIPSGQSGLASQADNRPRSRNPFPNRRMNPFRLRSRP